MFKSILAIELDCKAIKLVFFNKKIKLSKIIELEDNVVLNGIILNEDIILEIISSFIKENKLKVKYIKLNLISNLILIKNITLPTTTQKYLSNLISLQKQDYFSTDISDYKVAYKTSNNENNINVTLIAVPNSIINQYIKLFKKLNLKILNINTRINCLINSLTTKLLADNKNAVILIDIGFSFTTVSIFTSKTLLFSRNIEFGSDELNEIIFETDKFVGFCKSKFTGINMTTIYILKYKWEQNELAKFKSYFKLDIKIGNKEEVDFASVNELIKSSDFNLLTDEYLNKLKYRNRLKAVIITIILNISVILLIILTLNLIIDHNKKILNNTYIDLKKYEESDYINSKITKLELDLKTKHKILDNIKVNSVIPHLDNVLKYKPNKINIQTISINNNHATIYGNMDEFDFISSYIVSLEKIEYFSNINFNITLINNLIYYTIEFDINSGSDIYE